MQTIWKGAISFGLVSIPVKLYAATQERGVSFHQVHAEDGGRIRYKRVCSIDGEEVAFRDIAKGYELPDGDTIVLTDDDFASLPLATSRTIEVELFVPLEQVDGLYFNKAYYLDAEGPGAKPYVLLRDALERTGRVALVKVALRQREALAILRSHQGVLVLQTMLWPDEIRDPAAVAPAGDVSVRPQEVAMAESYIETLSGDFDPTAYSDAYREALEALVEAKAAGREVVPAEDTAPRAGNVVDLMEALRQSVAAAKARRGEGESGAAAVAATGADPAGGGDEPAAPARKRVAARKAAGQPAATNAAAKKASTAAKAAAKTSGSKPPATSRAAGEAASKAASKASGATSKEAAASKAASQPAAQRRATKAATSRKAPAKPARRTA